MSKYSSRVPPPSTPDRCPCGKKTCCSGAPLSPGALYWYPCFFRYFLPNKTKVLCFPGAKRFCYWWGRGWTLQERQGKEVRDKINGQKQWGNSVGPLSGSSDKRSREAQGKQAEQVPLVSWESQVRVKGKGRTPVKFQEKHEGMPWLFSQKMMARHQRARAPEAQNLQGKVTTG